MAFPSKECGQVGLADGHPPALPRKCVGGSRGRDGRSWRRHSPICVAASGSTAFRHPGFVVYGELEKGIWAKVGLSSWENISEIGNGAQDKKGLTAKMKMAHVLDQGGETEFLVESEEMRATCVKNYVKAVGGLPCEKEEPSIEQLSAMNHQVYVTMMACEGTYWETSKCAHLPGELAALGDK